ncbi:hypothetical protein CEXT_319591 [Caerostris extrusa]|uniref:Uncharacterized protein n=1 Tax=Caerostris extrusa TaxID=172846 RepID=A0AAV4WVT6_CAEEX|nr:hypothetical protein CEXT_319591 [Caerostris extrusa]
MQIPSAIVEKNDKQNKHSKKRTDGRLNFRFAFPHPFWYGISSMIVGTRGVELEQIEPSAFLSEWNLVWVGEGI